MGLRFIGPPVCIIFYIEHNINSKFNIGAALLAVLFNPIWSWASAGLSTAGPWATTEIIEFETFSFYWRKKNDIRGKNTVGAAQTAAVRGTDENNPVSCTAEVH